MAHDDDLISRDEYKKLARAAHAIIASIVKAGQIPTASSLKCTDCGGAASGYDHRDYREPETVQPVCQSCNKKRGPALPNSNDYYTHENEELFYGCQEHHLALDINLDELFFDFDDQTVDVGMAELWKVLGVSKKRLRPDVF